MYTCTIHLVPRWGNILARVVVVLALLNEALQIVGTVCSLYAISPLSNCQTAALYFDKQGPVTVSTCIYTVQCTCTLLG